jgi:Holliday junction resolvase RusA-like endonuclease
VIEVPDSFFFVKKKPRPISKRSVDLDNCLKLLQDTCTRTIGFDDQFITQIQTKKIPSHHGWCIHIAFQILDKPAWDFDN